MKCYIFNSSTSPENAAVSIEQMLSTNQMEKVHEEAQKLATSLAKSGVTNVKIYGSNRSESNHTVSILVPVLEKYGLMSEEDVFLSADFRDRDYGRVYDHSKQKIGLQNVLRYPFYLEFFFLCLKEKRIIDISSFSKKFQNYVYFLNAGIHSSVQTLTVR